MIRDDSPLTRLPSSLNRRQAIYLDGIRHAAEIVAFAYARLSESLTIVARTQAEAQRLPTDAFTSVFLDAWAIVDAIDRMRSLLLAMPGAERIAPPDGELGFITSTQSIRDLRNVADHLAQRVDYVIARDGSALGKLRWVTRCADSPTDVLSCILLPGTTAPGDSRIINPVGQPLADVTDLVTLQAGEYEANLSHAVLECRRTIGSLEDSLERSLLDKKLSGDQAGSDVMVALRVQLQPPNESSLARPPAA